MCVHEDLTGGPAVDLTRHIRAIFWRLTEVKDTKAVSVPSSSAGLMKENRNLVCNNNVDSLKGRNETVKTLYILLKASFLFGVPVLKLL